MQNFYKEDVEYLKEKLKTETSRINREYLEAVLRIIDNDPFDKAMEVVNPSDRKEV